MAPTSAQLATVRGGGHWLLQIGFEESSCESTQLAQEVTFRMITGDYVVVFFLLTRQDVQNAEYCSHSSPSLSHHLGCGIFLPFLMWLQ